MSECSKCGKCCIIVRCPHLTPDKICGIYENRPEDCKNYPTDADWVPTGCTAGGWFNEEVLNSLPDDIIRKIR